MLRGDSVLGYEEINLHAVLLSILRVVHILFVS